MKVCMAFEIDDTTRKALRKHYGQSGLATRKDVNAFVNAAVGAALQGVVKENPPKKEGK